MNDADQVIAIALAAGASTAPQIIAALDCAGFKIVEKYVPDETSGGAMLSAIASGKLGRRIAAVREERGLTQEALSQKLDCHWITVSKLERSEMNVTADWLLRISEALEVPAAEFIQGWEAIDNPVGFVQEIIDRRGITASKLCKACGIAPSTLNRAMKPGCKFVLSARVLKKFKEWDLAQ